MSFNPDLKKQAQEVIFSRITKKINPAPLIFSNGTVGQTTFQNHLGVILDYSLSFDEHPSKVKQIKQWVFSVSCRIIYRDRH